MRVMPQTHRDKRVLAFVNRIRKDLGLRPVTGLLKGNKGSDTYCPIARTIVGGSKYLDAEVYNDEIVVYDGRIGDDIVIPTPRYVSAFIYSFDNGNLPRYERARW